MLHRIYCKLSKKLISFVQALIDTAPGAIYSNYRGGLMAVQKPEKSFIGHLLDASSIGIQLVVSTFAGFLIGYGLDRLFHTSPWLTFIFLVLGIISGFRELLKLVKKSDKWDNNGNSKGRI